MSEHTEEHEEPSARATWWMSLVRWALLIAVTAVATAAVLRFWGPAPGASSARAQGYYCPMHPEVTSDRPGECPICHMQLERIPADGVGAHDTHAQHPPPHDASMTEPAGMVPVTLTLDRVQLGGIGAEVLRPRAVSTSIRAPAVVVAPEDRVAQVRVRANGFVERVAVQQTGVQVSAGQPLAWVYSPQVLQAQQEWLASARWGDEVTGAALTDHAREALALLGVAPQDLDAIARTRTPLRAIPLRAPIAGVVMRREAVLGMYATPETLLYEIAALDRVWVTASVDARDLIRVRRGAPASFRAADAPARAATVTWIEPVASLETRTARVRVELQNPGGLLRPGAVGELEITTTAPAGEAEALHVPRDAVIDTGARQYVFVDRGEGRYEPRIVSLGPLDAEGYPVRDGLRAGEHVVTRGTFLVDAESRLRATLAPAAPTDAGAPR